MAKKNRKITAPNESDDSSQPFNNSRWEKFVQNLTKGDALGDAYIDAGFDAASNEIASAAANRLLKNVKIANRLAYLKKKAADAMIADVTEVLRNMTTITRISPFEIMADIKKYGMFVESVEFETKKVKEEIVDKKTGNIKEVVKEKQVIKKIKTVSKAKMYELIGRYYSMFTDTLKHEGGINLNPAPVHLISCKVEKEVKEGQ